MSLKFKVYIGAVVGFLLIVLLSFVSYYTRYAEYAKMAQTGGTPQLKGPSTPREAIVVLTGDRGRIPAALELLRTREHAQLIISGTGKGITLTELVNSQGEPTGNLQVIWQKIILESNSTSTIENAEESKKILQEHKITRVILVTSDYHMSRSLALFRKLAKGPEYIPYPTQSEFTELLNGKLEHTVEGISKFILEYWKDFLYQFYLFQIL